MSTIFIILSVLSSQLAYFLKVAPHLCCTFPLSDQANNTSFWSQRKNLTPLPAMWVPPSLSSLFFLHSCAIFLELLPHLCFTPPPSDQVNNTSFWSQRENLTLLSALWAVFSQSCLSFSHKYSTFLKLLPHLCQGFPIPDQVRTYPLIPEVLVTKLSILWVLPSSSHVYLIFFTLVTSPLVDSPSPAQVSISS